MVITATGRKIATTSYSHQAVEEMFEKDNDLKKVIEQQLKPFLMFFAC